jgi:hypothetical protein
MQNIKVAKLIADRKANPKTSTYKKELEREFKLAQQQVQQSVELDLEHQELLREVMGEE